MSVRLISEDKIATFMEQWTQDREFRAGQRDFAAQVLNGRYDADLNGKTDKDVDTLQFPNEE